MGQVLESFGVATIFSTVDKNNGCWQVEIAKGDKKNTMFLSNYGLLQFIGIPFELKIEPDKFHRAMDVIWYAVQRQFRLVHLDDVVIFS